LKLKKGLRPHVPDPRDLLLVNYWDHTEAKVPSGAFGCTDLVKPDECLMLANGPDPTVSGHPNFGGAGDCAEAMLSNATRFSARLGGGDARISADATLQMYGEIEGYVIGKPSTDIGTEPRKCFQYWRKVGALDAEGGRHKIKAFLFLEPHDVEQLTASLFEFEIAAVAYELPGSAEEQAERGEPWSVVKGSAIDGGHMTLHSGRDAKGNFTDETWGMEEGVEPAFDARYMVAGSAVFLDEEALKGGKLPNGFDLEKLLHDLKAVAGS
jgi:hypothetical protein